MNKQKLLGTIVICILILGVILLLALKHKTTSTPTTSTPTTSNPTTSKPTPLTIFTTTTQPPVNLPSYLFNHPNNWSANPNEVMLYNDQTSFLESSFYTKYITNLISVPNGVNQTIQKSQYRIVFMSQYFQDTTIFYLDNSNIHDYVQALYDCQKSGFIPTELNAQNITTFTLPNQK